MKFKAVLMALCLMAATAAGCAGGGNSESGSGVRAGGNAGELVSLKAPMTTAVAALDDVVRKVEAGNPAGGREAYQVFANAFGQVLGPVSLKDTTVATKIANANTGLQEALERSQIDRTTVKREADSLLKGLYAAADVIGVSLGATASAQVGMAQQPARVIEVQAREYRFEPRVIRVMKGERVTIRLRNVGTEKHEWESEALHAEIKPISPGTTGEVTFTAPNRAGTFEFACHVDGHYEKGMRGFVVVR